MLDWVVGKSHFAELCPNVTVFGGLLGALLRLKGLHFEGFGHPLAGPFFVPFLVAQRSNFKGSGCHSGSNSERFGRP